MPRRIALSAALVLLCGCDPSSPSPTSTDAASASASLAHTIERGLALDVGGLWTPPPGHELVHQTGGFAKILCSAVFITGLDPADAIANIGGFTAPFSMRDEVIEREIDRVNETVTLTLRSGLSRRAKRYRSQGCITHPLDHDGIHFDPVAVQPMVPDPNTTPWPTGDNPALSSSPSPEAISAETLAATLEAAMQPNGKTLAFVAVHRGKIVAEAYDPTFNQSTAFESWSMGKSLTGILLGILVQRNVYQLDQRAPIPHWRDDARQSIRIKDILRMSSGLRSRAPRDPDYDPTQGYPDHFYLYTGDNAFEWAATRPQQWLPNTVGRYRNTDPVLANYLIRLALDDGTDAYHAFPQRALFDKLGIRSIVMETDPHGNFLTQGYELGSARDWARLGLLYLQDGQWNGEQILPRGYSDFAFELAPAWKADGRPIYGGAFLWRDLGFDIDVDYGGFAGAGGQFTIIVPEHDLVVVRLGKYTGATAGKANLNSAIKILMAGIAAAENANPVNGKH